MYFFLSPSIIFFTPFSFYPSLPPFLSLSFAVSSSLCLSHLLCTSLIASLSVVSVRSP